MTDYEKAKERLERRVERRRAQAATWVSGAMALFAFVLMVVLASGVSPRAAVIVEPLLALTLSASITLGARAIEGPLKLANRRREATSASAGTAALLLWLGCFCAIQIALLAVDLVGRWNPEPTRCRTDGDRLQAIVTIFDGTQRTIAISDCRVGTSKRRIEPPSISNRQALANADTTDENGGEN